MPLSVTSWFQSKIAGKNPDIIRKFMLGSSDYSQYVTKWPSFSLTWDDVRPRNLTIKFANEDRAFNMFIEDPINFVNSGSVQLGLNHPTSGDELIDMFLGTVDAVKFAGRTCDISLVDKFQALSNRVVGTQDSAADYTTSNYLPSDLAWYVCTSWAGLSAIESISNPDIDFASFQAWAAVFSGDTVITQGKFTGQKATEILKKIARITLSTITRVDNKIYFKRFSLVDSVSTVYDDSLKWNVQLEFDGADIVNKIYMAYNYSPASDYHQGTVIQANTPSVNSFGLYEQDMEDKKFWYVNSQSAANLAQRILLTNKVPFQKVSINTGAQGMLNVIGDMIQFTDSHLQLSSQTYRIMGAKYDLDQLSCQFDLTANQVNNAFILNSSSLDGSDVLS